LAVNRGVLHFNTPGLVEISYVDLTDVAGNKRRYLSSELAALGIATSFSLIGSTPDTLPPSLVNLTFPTSLDLTLGNQNFAVNVNANDGLGSGVYQAVLWFDRPMVTDIGSFSLMIVSNWSSTTGFVQRQVLAANVPGLVNLTRVELTDRVGNTKVYSAQQLAQLGFATSINLVGAVPDITAPTLSNLVFTSSIDVTATSSNFSINATAFDDKGVQQMVIWLDRGVSWDIGLFPLIVVSNWSGSSGFAQREVSAGNLPGFVSISRVEIKDIAGNTRTYQSSELESLGIVTQFGISNGLEKYLAGDNGNQTLNGGAGNDQFRGFLGYDVANIGGDLNLATIVKQFDRSYRVSSALGTDLLTGMEQISSGSQKIALGGADLVDRKFNDFTGDGKADIAFRSIYGGLALWTMNGPAIANIAVETGVALAWRVVGEDDFNGDGKADLLWRHNDGGVAVWLMDGLTMLPGSTGLAAVSNDWMIQDVGDYNGDGKSDILWRHIDGTTLVWTMNGADRTGFGVPAVVGWDWRVAGSGDTDGDGKDDIVMRNETNGSIYIWRMNGTALAATGTGYVASVGSEWEISAIADLNADGRSDLIWRNRLTGEVYGWMMNGTTIEQSGYIGARDLGWEIQGAGDFNGDGKADLLWSTASGSTSIWQLNGLALTSATNGPSIGTGWLAI
jgi:FG-GAP-like repeat/FG-GAP repeat